MKKSKKISVLMSAYKTQDYIEEAICSILDQKLPYDFDLELIIGIDGCQETYDVVKNIKDNRIGIFFSEENIGTYNIFNSILPLSKGCFFLRFDSDDIMGKDYIFSMWENIALNDLDFTGSKFVCFNDDMTNTIKHFNEEFISEGVRMWKRESWNKIVGSFEPWICSADREANNRAIYGKSANFSPTEGIYFCYRNHEHALTMSSKTRGGTKIRNHYANIINDRKRGYKKGHKPNILKPKIYPGVKSGLLFEDVCGEVELHPFTIKIKNKVHDSRKKSLNWVKKYKLGSKLNVNKPLTKNKINKKTLKGMTISANMATIPSRFDAAKEAINSIINQVDVVRVYLNNFEKIPDFIAKNKKIEYEFGKEDLHASGKHYWSKNKNEYYFTIDDDIIYPPSYVKDSLKILNMYDDMVIISNHGRVFTKDPTSYYSDPLTEVIHFTDEKNGNKIVSRPPREINRLVNIGGTGVSVKNTNFVKIELDRFKYYHMDDIEVSIQANEQKIPIIVRKDLGKLKDNSKKVPKNTIIYKSSLEKDSVQTYRYNIHNWKCYLPNKGITNKTISVLISAYKAEKWIKTSVNSVLSQSLPEGWNLELIVGVDGCEETFKTIMEISDSRLGVINFEENAGTYNTFNAIAAKSSGYIIHRFDADDIMNEGWLQRVVSSFVLNDDINLLYGKCLDFTEDMKEVIPRRGLEHIKSYAPDGPAAWRSSFFFEQIGGYKSFPCGADTDARYRSNYLPGGKARIIDYVSLFRRIAKHSLTYDMRTNDKSPIRRDIQKKLKLDEEEYKKKLKIPKKVIPDIREGKICGKLFEDGFSDYFNAKNAYLKFLKND